MSPSTDPNQHEPVEPQETATDAAETTPAAPEGAGESSAVPAAASGSDAPERDAAPAGEADEQAGEQGTAADETGVDKEAARAGKPSTPARRRDSRGPVDPDVVVRAQAKYVRTSARKARLVCDQIRGKDVAEAQAILAFTPRAVAKPWAKLLTSAIANAEHNHELVSEDLRVLAVYADEGPTIKRFRPRAMGRATSIRKRTSHLTIALAPKTGSNRKGGR